MEKGNSMLRLLLRRNIRLGLFAGLTLVMSSAFAAPVDPYILTVEGEQLKTPKQYHVDQLRSEFENVVLETRTPWTTDEHTISYRGPRIADVLQQGGIDSAKSVQFVAYDNFISEVTLDEIEAFQPIFAIDRACVEKDLQAGRCRVGQEFTPLSPEEQGPIFLVWPYDQLPAAYVPARNSIWVWFVVAVRPAA